MSRWAWHADGQPHAPVLAAAICSRAARRRMVPRASNSGRGPHRLPRVRRTTAFQNNCPHRGAPCFSAETKPGLRCVSGWKFLLASVMTCQRAHELTQDAGLATAYPMPARRHRVGISVHARPPRVFGSQHVRHRGRRRLDHPSPVTGWGLEGEMDTVHQAFLFRRPASRTRSPGT